MNNLKLIHKNTKQNIFYYSHCNIIITYFIYVARKIKIKQMSEQIQTHILSRYKVIKKIGSGAYGHVFKVVDRKTKKIKALKKNFDAFNNSTDAQRTYRQIMFLLELRHPNVIILQEILKAENGKDIYLVFEHMDVDLYALIRQNILQEKHKKYILYQTAKSLYFLHTAGLIHRDLKPSNILVNQSCDAKLCDFGLVRSIDDKNVDNYDILTEYIATRWYRAPEILLGSRVYSKGIDIWSYGCMIAQMFRGKPLFPGKSTTDQIQKVLMWTGVPTNQQIGQLKVNCGKQVFNLFSKIKPINKKQIVSNVDPECFDLLCRCLEFDPSKRLSIEQILKHPYLKDFYEPSELKASKGKIKLPINDNRRLSLKDYRNLIYEEIKRRNKGNFETDSHRDVTLYRIRQKPKKSVRTEQSDHPGLLPTKSSKNYENNSRTVSIKRNQNSVKKKTFYKGQSLYSKNLKTIDHQQDAQPIETKKMTVFKDQNARLTKNVWNRGKRSVTEGDARKKSKLLSTQIGFM